MNPRHFFPALLLSLTLAAPYAQAEETTASPLHVLRPILHTEQEQAELCLEFDHALDAVGNVAHIASSLHLESDGKTIPISARNVSLGGNQLCLSSLEHRRDYRLALAALRDAKGAKLSYPYSLSFTMPARHAALAFVAKENRENLRGGLTLWRDNPTLHSVNSARIKIELYRITDTAHMAEAWNQRMQSVLAPSESLYFARNNGTLVWKGELLLPSAPDRNVESAIDFAGQDVRDFPRGLYLIAASDADEIPTKDKRKEEKTEETKSDDDKADALPPAAAAWLLRSDLNLEALRDDKSYTALAETANASFAVKDIHLIMMDANEQTLAEAQSDANGLAVLTPKPDKMNAAQTLIGIGPRGDVAFLDLTRDTITSPTLPPLVATLSADQTAYAPSETINVTLSARDLHKRPLTLAGSTMQLQRPDRSIYDSASVTLDANGAERLFFPAPVAHGLWHLVWRQADGSTLAENNLRISANPLLPELSVTADRAVLASDGGVNLTIRSETNAKTPVPYIAGRVELAWSKAGHPFATWKDYDFDDGKSLDLTPKPAGSFLTDANGIAHLHIALPAGGEAPSLRQARLRVVSDRSFAALDPAALVLPVKPADTVLGIRPRANHGHFPENSAAHFDLVALDPNGQRHGMEDLAYQIYEEGRNFEWFQSEGHWDYKPLQQRRRIGGGNLSIPGDGQASLEWPVTSGTYQLEITNADGALLARTNFNAGWGVAERRKEETPTLDLKPAPATLQTGTPQKINFTLARAGLVTAIVADDHIRSVIHAAYPAGTNSFAFTPAADWGSRVQIRVAVHDSDNTEANGNLTLSSSADLPPHVPPKPLATVKANLPADPDIVLRTVATETLQRQQSWNPIDAKTHGVAGAQIAFLAPEPFFDAPALLNTVLHQEVFATKDIARQLETLHLWRETILAANLMQETELRAVQTELRMRLMARQKTDGSFPSIPGETGDIASTSAAIEALAPQTDAATRPVIELASAWLRHRLENTWFGETERPQRATAYAALAAAGKLDQASLHYFSDTSADKQMTPLASAQIAYAFAAIHDRPASNFWLDKVKATKPDPANFPSETLPVLLANEFFTSDATRGSLETSSKRAIVALGDMRVTSDFLLALWSHETRAGTWRMETGRDTKNLRGIFAIPLPEKTPPPLRNPADRPLYLTVMSIAKAPAVKNNIQRRIVTLDGGDTVASLKRGATYLVMLEGTWNREETKALVINDDPQPALSPITCAIEAPNGDGFLGWLAYKPPSHPTACERNANGLAVLLARAENEPNNWRIAYLARANGTDAHGLRPPSAQPFAAPNPDDKDAHP